MTVNCPVILIILDGFGYRKEQAYNAIAKANTPCWDKWLNNYPSMLLSASGSEVGLPDNQMGNSEVGHMHIGSGRTVYQDYSRINHDITAGSLEKNPNLTAFFLDCKINKRHLHLMGLLSAGGVHSHEDHLLALLGVAIKRGFTSVYLHLFLDGRDTPPRSALVSLKKLADFLMPFPQVAIVSIAGRYFAMDRDNRWERTGQVFRLMTQGISDFHFDSAYEAIEYFYQNGISDEFIPPTLIGTKAFIHPKDSLLFFNFRADRARQLTDAFTNPNFQAFDRVFYLNPSQLITMTSYGEQFINPNLFPPQILTNTLGEIVANHGLKQLRIAETEKYAHVTFFFNGGREQAFAKEERIMIASPEVATYDLAPEMSANKLTQTVIEKFHQETPHLTIINYANADMVGHTGNFAATVQAIECLDRCLSQLATLAEKHQAHLLITADHGNAECMFNESNHQAHTAHTCSLVPLVLVAKDWKFNRQYGQLSDVAPTILTLLGLDKPQEMTGKSLLTPNED